MAEQPPSFDPNYDYHGPGAQQARPPSITYPQRPPSTNIAPAVQSQQTAFQQNAALPANAMETLAKMNITPEQFMQIAHLIRSGAMPMTPAAPTPTQPPAPVQAPSQPAHQPQSQHAPAGPSFKKGEVIDLDMEEGEVDEEEVHDNTASRKFLKTPPKGPRNRSRSPQPRFDSARRAPEPRVRSPAGSYSASRSGSCSRNVLKDPAQETSPKVESPRAAYLHRAAHADSLRQPNTDIGSEARKFIRTMHQAGYSIDDLTKHVGNDALLRRFWQETGLPLTPAAAPSSSEQSKAPAKRVPAPKQAAPLDRSAYLAKLQAAKNKKPDVPATSSSSALPPTNGTTAPAANTSAPVATSQPSSASKARQPAKRTIDNILLRQRLEELKAKNAAKDKAPTAIATAEADMDHGMAVPQQPLSQTLASPSANRGNGLPGLFVSNTALTSPVQQHISRPQLQRFGSGNAAPSPLQKNVSAASPGNNSPMRPLGVSKGASSQERIIIHDSDESDGEVKADGKATFKQSYRTLPHSPMNAFPPTEPISNGSAPGTPMTPAEAEQQKKITAMRLEIAEREKKMNERRLRQAAALNAGAIAPASTSASEAGTPGRDQARDLLSEAAASSSEQADIAAKNEPSRPPSAAVNEQVHGDRDKDEDSQSGGDTPGSFDQMYEQSQDEHPVVASGVVVPSTRHRGDSDPEPMERLAPAPRPRSEIGDAQMDLDDSDMDDIYDEPIPVPAAHVTDVSLGGPSIQADKGDEDDDDVSSAMDTSSETSSQLAEVYGHAGSQAGLEAEPLPLPPPPPVPEPGDINNPQDATGMDTDGDVVETPGDGAQVDDDLAAELQPSEEELAAFETQAPQTPKYTPYVSPLRHFKDYRYHPEFLATVPGGFKSLSYNHKIDANEAVCRFETAGGICNDKKCEFQHFKDMVLSDNELLKLLGADSIPAKKHENIKKWKAGLASVLADIRQQNLSRDVNTISQRIAEFRRAFRGDPSKILLLDVEL